MRTKVTKACSVVALTILSIVIWLSLGAPDYTTHALAIERAHADNLIDHLQSNGELGFSTGSTRFDAEWVVATHMMTVLGLGQTLHRHTSLRADSHYTQTVLRSAHRLLEDNTLAFGRSAWNENPLASTNTANGHAYLGYINLALSMVRYLQMRDHVAMDGNQTADIFATNDRLVEVLARRLESSPRCLIETYPGEAYPADTSAVIASIALYDLAHNRAPRAIVHTCAEHFLGWVDNHYLVQRADRQTGHYFDHARGSGTALAAYFWHFSDSGLAAKLREGLHANTDHWFGFAAVREYPRGQSGSGDVDSGPVVLGYGVSATGFALGPYQQEHNPAFVPMLRLASVFGLRFHRWFVSGGGIGNSIMFAMITAGDESW